MKIYIKPEFMLTSLTATTTSAMNCALTPADRNRFDAIYGNGWENNSFGSTEGECEDKENIIEKYCKFSSGDINGVTQVFVS